MIPPLVRLPTTVLAPPGLADADGGDLDDLAACVELLTGDLLGRDLLAGDRTVVVGSQRTAAGDALDEFVVAAALAARTGRRLAVAARVGAGRAHALVARESTAAQLLGAADVVVLEGDPAACRDAAIVLAALFTEGAHTVVTATGAIANARNLPLPDVAGGPPVCWREGAALHGVVDGAVVPVGSATDATPSALPGARDAQLVVLDAPLAAPSALRAALAR
jgi:hypothetical protein